MELPYTAWVDVEALSSNSQFDMHRRQRFCKTFFIILSVAAIAGFMLAGGGVPNGHAAISSKSAVHDVVLAEQDEHEKGVCYVVHLLSGPVGDWLFSRYAANGMGDITACFERLPGSALLGCIFAPFIVPAFLVVLSCIGFGPAGVIAGSCAASWQATMGGFVAAGSCFAWLQSCAAAGCCAACAAAWPVLLVVCFVGICLTSSLTLHCACGWL
mmetsp:Transcript_33074/g.95086  ORF Transcript_33074/g.95086 Transcript_33074/m.95086 type:complete len:214 (-) Transcript_33074:49-690(-)